MDVVLAAFVAVDQFIRTSKGEYAIIWSSELVQSRQLLEGPAVDVEGEDPTFFIPERPLLSTGLVDRHVSEHQRTTAIRPADR
jgi:hypothetical protein